MQPGRLRRAKWAGYRYTWIINEWTYFIGMDKTYVYNRGIDWKSNLEIVFTALKKIWVIS